MIITHRKEKLFNAIVYFVKNTKYCNKTKLMKLLYYLDFWHFKETGASVTGLDYYAWDFGPYPVEFGSKMSTNKELKEYMYNFTIWFDNKGQKISSTFINPIASTLEIKQNEKKESKYEKTLSISYKQLN